MIRTTRLALMVTLGAASLGAVAHADDTNSDRPVKTHQQMMKDCMAKERSANSGASEDDMKKTCRAKVQSYENHPSETAQPPNNPGSP